MLKLFFPVTLFAFINFNALGSSGASDNESVLFHSSEPVNITIQLDMKKIMEDTSADPEYSEAILIHTNKDNKTFQIKIKARGNTRRNKSLCEFPPLKINFVKGSTVNTIFEGQDKIKMVTHCNASESYQNYVLLEYLNYKIFNLVTENSYKVRLVQVTYRDTGQNYEDMEKIGFMIEDEDQMAERIDGEISDKKIWSSDSCNQDAVDVLVLFQFMIGNTDWWIHTRHNIDLVQTQDMGLLPVPFDFDYAGIINTPYATPSPQLPIAYVKSRFLKASCYDMKHYEKTISLYNQKKTAILSEIEASEFLDKKSKKNATNYIEEFYEIINDPKKFEKYLAATCDYVNNPPDK